MKRVQVHISSTLTEEEWNVLRAFCEKVKRLKGTKQVTEGNRIGGKIQFEHGKGLRFESSLPPEEQISEFLMAFRFFYLQNEKTNFPKILNIIGKHVVDEDARKALKIYRKQWENSLFGNAIQVKMNNEPVTSSLLLDLWFNAHYFHSDEDKEKELARLKGAFSEDFSKYMLLDSVFEATKVIFKVYEGLIGIVDEHFDA